MYSRLCFEEPLSGAVGGRKINGGGSPRFTPEQASFPAGQPVVAGFDSAFLRLNLAALFCLPHEKIRSPDRHVENHARRAEPRPDRGLLAAPV